MTLLFSCSIFDVLPAAAASAPRRDGAAPDGRQRHLDPLLPGRRGVLHLQRGLVLLRLRRRQEIPGAAAAAALDRVAALGDDVLPAADAVRGEEGGRLRQRWPADAAGGAAQGEEEEVQGQAGRRLRAAVLPAEDGGRGRLLLPRQRQGQAVDGDQSLGTR